MSANDSLIKQAIVKTVVFFDIFDFPLTELEIWRNLEIKCELGDVRRALKSGKNPIARDKIEFFNGFYFLSGRRKILEERMRRYNYAERKFKRALAVARIFKAIPWIKMIAVGNMMGANNARNGSDIDFFIIAGRRRIWLVRFFCVVIAKILRIRPSVNGKRDKICLSFYVSEENLDLHDLMLRARRAEDKDEIRENQQSTDDIYFIYWLAGLMPIFDAGGTYDGFVAANGWLKKYLPNWQPPKLARRRVAVAGRGIVYPAVVDLFIGGLENFVKKFQLKIMPQPLKKLANKGTQVVVNSRIIKLHLNDRRSKFGEKFNKRLRELLIAKGRRVSAAVK